MRHPRLGITSAALIALGIALGARPAAQQPRAGRPEQHNMELVGFDDLQARSAYQAIKALVESQGGTLANVVKLTTYVTDMRYRADLAPIREEFFGKKGPASTLVEISALAHPDWMIEIEAIAVL